MATMDAGRIFVEAVRRRLDDSMAEAGFPFNDVYTDDESSHMSILYEGLVSDFLARYPGLDPVWDEEWRRHKDGCVDLWIKWSRADDSIEANLEHWTIQELATRFGDDSSVRSIDAALSESGEMEPRVDVIADLLETAMEAASR